MAAAGTTLGDIHQDRGFAFQAKTWTRAKFRTIELTQVFRQRNTKFVQVLHQLRRGQVTVEAVAFFQQCNRPLPPNKGIRPTVLYAKNVDVTAENERELQKLPGSPHTFESQDSVEVEDKVANKYDAERKLWDNTFFKQCVATKQLSLKVGAQVMLIKNEPTNGKTQNNPRSRLVNGSRGASTCSINSSSNTLYPKVRFRNGTVKVIAPVEFSSALVGVGKCIRHAIPLKLAYALSIHKAQGMTLDYVKADVGGVFQEAMAYVALSRASDENGLELRNFLARKVRANVRALEYYENPNRVFPCWNEVWPVVGNEKPQEAKPPLPKVVPMCVDGKAFVFTGELNNVPRDDAEARVKACGGVIRSAVSGKTNYLVVGERLEDGRDVKCTSKYTKAQAIMAGPNKSNLRILNKSEFFELTKE